MKLDAWLRQRPSLDESLQVIESLCQVVNAVHDRGDAVGGLAPDRIEVASGQCDISGAGGRPGPPEYTAPDADANAPAAADDVYAVGTITWEILAGRPAGEAPQHLAEVRPDIPRELADAITACLERSADWRPKDLTYLAQMAAVKQKGTGPARAPSTTRDRSRRRTPARAAGRRSGPSRTWPLLAALVVVVGLGFFAWKQFFDTSGAATPGATPPSPAATPAPAATAEAVPPAAQPTAAPAVPPAANAPTPRPEPVAVPDAPPQTAGPSTTSPAEPSSTPAAEPRPVEPAPASPPAAAPPAPAPAVEPPPTRTPAQPAPRPAAPPEPEPAPAPETAPPPQAAPATPNAPSPSSPAPQAQAPAAPPAPPAPPAVLSVVSPLEVKRPGKAMLDLRGQNFRSVHRARVLPVKKAPQGITIVRQKNVSNTLITVLIDLSESVEPGEYGIAVEDGLGGGRTEALVFKVTK